VGEQPVAVIGTLWREPHAELAYATRSIAAAASRWADVSVFVPGDGPPEADGAFDLQSVGTDVRSGRLDDLRPDAVVVVDRLTPEVSAVLSAIGSRAVFSLTEIPAGHDPSWGQLSLTPDDSHRPFVNIHVPVNRQAELHRHNAFGFTGYQLVLSGRPGGLDDLPASAAWITATFHGADVIVVEHGVASAWRGRALRGQASVDSRMDLWRLVAHACVCIDLAPGRHFARECVESLRFGTPIIVHDGSGPAATHARASGGATFGDPEDLLRAIEPLRSGDVRSARARQGRDYADSTYGDPATFAERVRTVLTGGAPTGAGPAGHDPT
jgi:hypothetical protein